MKQLELRLLLGLGSIAPDTLVFSTLGVRGYLTQQRQAKLVTDSESKRSTGCELSQLEALPRLGPDRCGCRHSHHQAQARAQHREHDIGPLRVEGADAAAVKAIERVLK